MSDWVATAGGLRDLRLNAPSRWFLASQAKITTCKTKTHRSSLRSPVEARSGLLALSVMATPMEQTPCQVRETREKRRKIAGYPEMFAEPYVRISHGRKSPLGQNARGPLRHFVRPGPG